MTKSGGDTPLMQQYRDIKARHADAILFFRMGDFYEMFNEDAKLASRLLGLTLTTRNNGGAASTPLAGVPVKAAAEYVRRLVDMGYRVAICEQTEDPKQAKGVVRREVVETVTPGAVLAEEWLDGSRNNYLAAIVPGDPTGLAMLDLSTGEFVLEVVEPDELRAALARYEPREIVLPTGTELDAELTGAMITPRDPWEFDPDQGIDDLARHYRIRSLDGLGISDRDRAAVGAAGALLRYAKELQPGGLPQLAHPAVRRPGESMPLDEMSHSVLEFQARRCSSSSIGQ